uniref:Large ribosomal subunit protein mL44 n=1 Tax=Eubosmina coregoni TaxID=186181 RepID=A0A4Y7LN50_9CRUS|nr:EOG090X0DYO [Eubosmina coregoni]SVE70071.1 EOG090X0DYO [Eubosmina coregoni]
MLSPTPFPVSRFKIRESAIDLKQSESSFENVGSYEAEDFVPKRHYKPKWVAPTLRELKKRKDAEIEKNHGEKIFHRSTFLEWNYDAEIFAFSNRLGEKFDDQLLRSALTHKSYIQREMSRLKDMGIDPDSIQLKENDELATKGEELIERFVKGYLRAVFTRAPEEMIRALHGYLTSTQVVVEVAKHIGVGDLMLCADFPCEPATYKKTFKALVAALEQSSGEEKARIFVQDLLVTMLYGQDVNEIWNPIDPVGILARILKRESRGEPEFRLIRQAGPNTILASYHVAVYSDKNFVAEGTGESIETAQEMAARDALKRFFSTEDSMRALPFGRQLKKIQEKITQLEFNPNIALNEWTSYNVSSLAQS